MKKVVVIGALLLGTLFLSTQKSNAQLDGERIYKGGLTYFNFFFPKPVGSLGGFGLNLGVENQLKEKLSATVDLSFYKFGVAGFKVFAYAVTPGINYYIGDLHEGLYVGCWGTYDKSGIGLAARAGYKLPIGDNLLVDANLSPGIIFAVGGSVPLIQPVITIGYRK